MPSTNPKLVAAAAHHLVQKYKMRLSIGMTMHKMSEAGYVGEEHDLTLHWQDGTHDIAYEYRVAPEYMSFDTTPRATGTFSIFHTDMLNLKVGVVTYNVPAISRMITQHYEVLQWTSFSSLEAAAEVALNHFFDFLKYPSEARTELGVALTQQMIQDVKDRNQL